jgi:hypothetical protein
MLIVSHSQPFQLLPLTGRDQNKERGELSTLSAQRNLQISFSFRPHPSTLFSYPSLVRRRLSEGGTLFFKLIPQPFILTLSHTSTLFAKA